jgi:hypothetical protein
MLNKVTQGMTLLKKSLLTTSLSNIKGRTKIKGDRKKHTYFLSIFLYTLFSIAVAA